MWGDRKRDREAMRRHAEQTADATADIAATSRELVSEVRHSGKGWRYWLLASVSIATLIVTAIGVRVAVSTRDEVRNLNPRYAAELIRRGPFEEKLPSYLEARGFEDAGIADPSAAQAIDTVQLVIRARPDEDPWANNGGTQVWAHFETYRTESEAEDRARHALEDAKERHSLSGVTAASDGFCGDGGAFWTCHAHRGPTYVEVTMSPAPNATLSLARGTVAAMLNYADSRARLATD
jgi:hypothetical protein